jgi:hypothetical protein
VNGYIKIFKITRCSKCAEPHLYTSLAVAGLVTCNIRDSLVTTPTKAKE